VADASGPWSLFLWGVPGTGKTYAACAVLREWHLTKAAEWISEPTRQRFASSDPPAGPLFVSFRDLAAKARDFGPGRDEACRLVEASIGARRLLVVDDLPADLATQFTQDLAHRLVDHRYANRLPTVFTSNADPGTFHRTAPAIASRLAAGTILDFAGLDRRLAAREP